MSGDQGGAQHMNELLPIVGLLAVALPLILLVFWEDEEK